MGLDLRRVKVLSEGKKHWEMSLDGGKTKFRLPKGSSHDESIKRHFDAGGEVDDIASNPPKKISDDDTPVHVDPMSQTKGSNERDVARRSSGLRRRLGPGPARTEDWKDRQGNWHSAYWQGGATERNKDDDNPAAGTPGPNDDSQSAPDAGVGSGETFHRVIAEAAKGGIDVRLTHPDGTAASFAPPSESTPELKQQVLDDFKAGAEAQNKAAESRAAGDKQPKTAQAQPPDGMSSGEKGVEAGIMEKARAEAGLAQKQSEFAQAHALELEQMKRDRMAKMAENQSRIEQIQQDILGDKVDPNRYWSQKTTGQKIMSGIALILGGIGGGILGRENPASQIIDAGIQRDIDAQKLELGKKQTLLSRYIDQGHDIQSASVMAEAEAKSIFAANLEKAAADSGSPVAMANAKIAANQYRMDASAKMQEAELRGFQLQAARASMEYQQRLREAMGSGGTDAIKAMLLADPSKLLDRIVMTRQPVQAVGTNGEPIISYKMVPRLAATKTSEKATDLLAQAYEQDDKLAKIEKFARDHPGGTLSLSERGEAEALVNEFKLSWTKSQEGLSRLSPLELGLVDGMIKDPAAFFSTDAIKHAKLKAVRGAIESRRKAIENSYLLP